MLRPLLLNFASGSEALPMVAAALARRPVRGARGWIVAWTVSLLVFDNLALLMSLRRQSNVWLGYVATPLQAGLLLWGLSYWQRGDLARLTMRFVMAAALVVWALLTVAFENTATFSRAAEPMVNLVCVGAAAATLLLRSLASRTSLLGQDWFWICGGVALYYAAWSAMGPLSMLLAGGSLALFQQAYQVTGVLVIVAMLAIARGMACPVET